MSVGPATTDSIDTITIPGVGEVPSPSATGERQRRQDLLDPSTCPVDGCDGEGFESFAALRAHFGGMKDEAHATHDLNKSDYA